MLKRKRPLSYIEKDRIARNGFSPKQRTACSCEVCRPYRYERHHRKYIKHNDPFNPNKIEEIYE